MSSSLLAWEVNLGLFGFHTSGLQFVNVTSRGNSGTVFVTHSSNGTPCARASRPVISVVNFSRFSRFYPSSPALTMGLQPAVAAMLLLVVQPRMSRTHSRWTCCGQAWVEILSSHGGGWRSSDFDKEKWPVDFFSSISFSDGIVHLVRDEQQMFLFQFLFQNEWPVLDIHNQWLVYVMDPMVGVRAFYVSKLDFALMLRLHLIQLSCPNWNCRFTSFHDSEDILLSI